MKVWEYKSHTLGVVLRVFDVPAFTRAQAEAQPYQWGAAIYEGRPYWIGHVSNGRGGTALSLIPRDAELYADEKPTLIETTS